MPSLSFQAETIGFFTMTSLRTLPFTFLLLNILSDIQAEDDFLSCSKPNIAELGKDIMIKCKNNAPILSVGIRFCPLKGDHCISKGVIKKQNITLTDGETTLEFHNNTVSLSINPIKISHEGTYILSYIAKNQMDKLSISLEVFAPYTNPQVMKQEDTLICTASGGYPEETLYWVFKAGTNVTHKSTSQSVKNEDGSFSLSNTLQLESAPSETEYCCIFNHTRVPSRQQVSACMTLANVRTSMIIEEKTTLNTPRIITIVIAIISLACIVLAVTWWRKGRKNYLLQKWQKFAHANKYVYVFQFSGKNPS